METETPTPIAAKIRIEPGDVVFLDERILAAEVARQVAKEIECTVIMVRPEAGQSVTDCVMKMPFKAVQDLLKGTTP